jgi:Ca2+-binding RTX toxin-like protein
MERVVQAADEDQTLSDTELTGLGTDSLVAIDEARLSGGGGDNVLDATAFSAGPVVLEGLAGSDTLRGGSGDDRLDGGSGGDVYGFADEGFGTDTLVEQPDCVDGDRLDLAGLMDGVTFRLDQPGPQNVAGGTIVLPSATAIEEAHGTSGADTFTGSTCPNLLMGAAGDDTLRGLAGADTLVGQLGSDALDGGEGSDVVAQTADADQLLTNDELTGAGTDALVSIERASLAGGMGANRLDASAFTKGPVSLFGGEGNDVLIGTRTGDLLDGQGADDQLAGGSGDDVLKGDDGDDVLAGQAGDDRLAAGSGNDFVSAATGDDRVNGSQGNDRVDGGAGNDVLAGGSGRDRLVGSKGEDQLRGGSGDDQLLARDGERDIVSGGSGKDRAVLDPLDVVRKVEKGAGTKGKRGERVRAPVLGPGGEIMRPGSTR